MMVPECRLGVLEEILAIYKGHRPQRSLFRHTIPQIKTPPGAGEGLVRRGANWRWRITGIRWIVNLPIEMLNSVAAQAQTAFPLR
jgi:hypothetical protein